MLPGRIILNSIRNFLVKKETSFNFVMPRRYETGFVLVTEGEAICTVWNGEKRTLKRGDIFLAIIGDKYKIVSTGPLAYIVSELRFSESCIENINSLPKFYKCDEIEVRELEKAVNLWQTRSWNAYTTSEIAILKLYLNIMQEKYLTLEHNDKDVLKAVSYIHENYKTNFTLEQISATCALSVSYLCTKFNKHMGLSVMEYRNKLRIDAAKEMLKSGLFSQKEIADELGYYDVCYFSKAFSKTCGITPSKYKLKHKKS